VIVPSHATCDELVRFFPETLARVRVIPHGLPDTIPAAETSSTEGQRRAPRDYVLFVGNERPYKNLANVLEAFALLQEEYEGFLVLAGLPLPPSESLLRRLDGLSLRARVRWTGYLPRARLMELYRGARLLVAPSTAEGFGFPLLESMAVGTPVVTSRGGATEEVAGEAALLVDPMSPKDIAQAMRRLLTEKELTRELSSRGKKRTAHFSWDESARETLTLYREVLTE
jgi:glycosyltransferase involved in cell wall biosynthesis